MTELRQIYLCGFMGAGKSTLLQRLNPPEGIKCYDLDDLVLAQTEFKAVGALVAELGWDFFRRKEREVLLNSLQRQESFVMALGGGSLTSELVETLNTKAFLLWLATPFEICLERVLLEGQKRPLAKEGPDFLKKLFKERELLYCQSKHHLFLKNQEQIQSYEDLLEFIKN